jgi:hypothetical protein
VAVNRLKSLGLELKRHGFLLAFSLNLPASTHIAKLVKSSKHAKLARRLMNQDLTEEEMRQALFGNQKSSTEPPAPVAKEIVADVVIAPPPKATTIKKSGKAFTPRLKVTLRVGNVFEGETQEITHEADTLSKLLAEQEDTKAARKKTQVR